MPRRVLNLNRTHCIECNVELVRNINTVAKGMIYIQSKCRDCWNKYYTARNKAIYNTDKERDRQLRKKFGITLEEYSKLFEDQSGKCAICEKSSDVALHVDHNHETGEVRGLLCPKCNHAIGLLFENPDIIYRAYEYLRKTTWEK